jgi:hypothetical protein
VINIIKIFITAREKLSAKGFINYLEAHEKSVFLDKRKLAKAHAIFSCHGALIYYAPFQKSLDFYD